MHPKSSLTLHLILGEWAIDKQLQGPGVLVSMCSDFSLWRESSFQLTFLPEVAPRMKGGLPPEARIASTYPRCLRAATAAASLLSKRVIFRLLSLADCASSLNREIHNSKECLECADALGSFDSPASPKQPRPRQAACRLKVRSNMPTCPCPTYILYTYTLYSSA